jgi:uncharacterized protein YecT (DUF1311 family)
MLAGLLMLLQAGGSDPPDLDDECGDPVTTYQMNICTLQEVQAADAALNEQWSRTVAVFRKFDAAADRQQDRQPGYYATLLEGQQAWLKFRDAQCLSESFMARGGSMQPSVANMCLTYLTIQRTEQLRSLENLTAGR